VKTVWQVWHNFERKIWQGRMNPWGDSTTGKQENGQNRAVSPTPETLPLFDSAGQPAVLGTTPAPKPKPAPQPEKRAHQRIPRWLERAESILRVLLRMYIGLAVCYAPWSHLFWDQNPLFTRFPGLAVFAAHGAVRGLVSGLGLLNLWIALQDAIHHGDK
jgi:hypothetical protein